VSFFGTSLSAQWAIDSFVNNPVSTAPNDQDDPKVIGDGSGGAIIVWQDLRNGNFDIYAQRIDSMGTVQWTADGVAVCTSANDQTTPVISGDGASGAIIAWSDSRSGSTFDIYAQRINAQGVAQWTPNGIPISAAGNNQLYPQITSDGAGGAVISWNDFRNAADYDIYAQRVNSSGIVQWTTNGVPVSIAANDQASSNIVSDGAGGAIISWNDYRNGTDYNIYAQRINGMGAIQWTVNGVAICTTKNDQTLPKSVSNKTGGAIIVWRDDRGGNDDIFAQMVDASGVVQWTANGIPITTAADNQVALEITGTSNGAVIVWQDLRNGIDTDIYAQGINSSGGLEWNIDGVPISNAVNDQLNPMITGDGKDGAIITWEDTRDGYNNYNIYAQRISASGIVQWKADGIAVTTAGNGQNSPAIVSDRHNGAIILWADTRNLTSDIYAQKIDPLGYLGVANPKLTNVIDVKGDQGGKLTVAWNASSYDIPSKQVITQYSIWRGIHLNAVPGKAAESNDPQKIFTSQTQSKDGRIYRKRIVNGATTNWELIGKVSSHYLQGYSYTVPTASDSTTNGIPYFNFFISAESSDPFVFWDSNIDSGYSVDNLAPEMPANVMGSVISNTVILHWNPNTENDLNGYNIYRSSMSSFNPDTMAAYAATSDTAYTDRNLPSSGGIYYIIRALDVHGNQSLSSNEVSIQITDIKENNDGIPAQYSLKQNYPNPFNPTTKIRYSIPQARTSLPGGAGLPGEANAKTVGGFVTLKVYDILGREVATLVNKQQQPGNYVVEFDASNLSSGVYFYQLSTEYIHLTKKLMLLK